TSGYATSVFGAGYSQPSGISVDANGNVYVSNFSGSSSNASSVLEFASDGTGDGTPVGGGFFEPLGSAVDGGGNVFVPDNGDHQLKVVQRVGVLTMLPGNFKHPQGVFADAAGDLWVAD